METKLICVIIPVFLLFVGAGIYVIVGLSANCQDCAITNEEAPHCYPPGLKKRGQMIISQFAKYRNVLAFSAGNEVGFVSPLDHSLNAPCLKKFVRDMRSFVASCNNLRKIPVGLVVGDIQREEKLSYFSCQGDEDPYENAEWFGLNTYIHCDPRAFELDQALGLKTLRSQLEGIPIPFVMTEFGCLNQAWPAESGFQSQRTFLEAEWMFDPEENFREVIAGAFAFEYSTEAANLVAPYPYQLFDPGNYGLGYFSPENCDECWTSCTYVPKPEFENLKSKYAATPTRGVTTRDSLKINEDSLSFPVCPPGWRMISEFQWSADNTTVFFAKNKSEEVVQMTVSIKSNPAYGLCPPTESLTCKNSSTPSEYNTFSTPQACSGWIPPLEDDNGIVLVWTPPETPSSSGRPSSYVRNHEHQWWLTGAINIFLKFLL